MDNTLYQTIGSYLGIPLTIIVSVIVFTVKFWFPKLINFFSEKGLIKFKIKLETEKEKQLAEFGKSITGFNKYFEKKYDVYPNMYSELIQVQGEIVRWENDSPIPDLKGLTEDDINQYLNLFKFSIPDKRNLISKWKNKDINHMDLLKLIPSHLRIMILDANNYFQENRIFLSREVESMVINIFVNFEEARIKFYYAYAAFKKKPDSIFEIKKIYETSNDRILQLMKLMKSELEHEKIEKTI